MKNHPPTLCGEGFEVYPVDERDMAALLEVYRGCEDFLALGPVPHASTSMIEKDLELARSIGGLYGGIVEGGQSGLAGVLDFVPDGYEGQAGEAFLELLMLAAPYRGHGLGARVLAALEQRLMAGGVRLLRAGVQANNPAAIRFWVGHGFVLTSGPKDLPDGTTCYDMEKQLA